MEQLRKTIIDETLKSGLVDRCVAYQTNRCKSDYLKEELRQEVWLFLMTYPMEKLSDAYLNGHLNALLTRFIANQFYSHTSAFYRRYRRDDERMEEITEEHEKIPFEEY